MHNVVHKVQSLTGNQKKHKGVNEFVPLCEIAPMKENVLGDNA